MGITPRTNIMRQSMRIGVLAPFLLTGCLAIPHGVHSDRNTLAQRREDAADTSTLARPHGAKQKSGLGANVVEELYEKTVWLDWWALLQPCYAGGDQFHTLLKRTYFIEDRDRRRIRAKALDRFRKDGLSGPPYWFFFAAGGTNLWIGMNIYDGYYPDGTGGFIWGNQVLGVHVFDAGRMLHTNVLKPFLAPDEAGGTSTRHPEFWIDPANHCLTYRAAREQYESYDVLLDKITPADRPPGLDFLSAWPRRGKPG